MLSDDASYGHYDEDECVLILVVMEDALWHPELDWMNRNYKS